MNPPVASILMYHGVVGTREASADWTQLPIEDFERQIALIARHWRPVPLGEVVTAVGGDGLLPPRAVAVTFDDGLLNNHTRAVPVLRRWNVPATFFVVSGFVETGELLWSDHVALMARAVTSLPPEERLALRRQVKAAGGPDLPEAADRWVEALKQTPRGMKHAALECLRARFPAIESSEQADPYRPMTPTQINELDRDEQFTIGGHTRDHEILSQCSPEEIRRQVQHDKHRLEAWTGHRIDLFAYPNGRARDLNPSAVSAVREAGYGGACTTRWGNVGGAADPWRLPRLGIGTDALKDPTDLLRLSLSGLHPRLKRLSRRLRRAVVLAILPWFCLAGACGGRPQGDADRSAEPDRRMVTVWAHHGRPDENKAMQRIIEAFNAAHNTTGGVRARVTFFPDRQYADKVSIAAASASLPDVVEVDGPYVGPWAAEGLLQPVGDLVTSETLGDFLGPIVEQGTYEGRLYALGAFDSALVVYYNREMIEQAGLDPPERLEAAWTWATFVDALRRVRPYCRVPLSLHMDVQSDEWFTYAFSPLVWSAGGRLIDTEAGRVEGVLNSAVNVKTFGRWKALFEKGLAEASSPEPNPFAAGLAAFDWTGHWMLASFEATEGLRYGVMPLPKMGQEVVTASGSWCWGLSSSCEDRQAAWEVVRWLLDPKEGIQPMVEANDAVPGRRRAFEYFPEYERMPHRLFRHQLVEAAHPRPRTPVYLTLTGAFAGALRDIALGAPVEPMLDRAAATIQRALDRRSR